MVIVIGMNEWWDG